MSKIDTMPGESTGGGLGALLERQFHLKEFGTTARTEVLAGVTTFLTMAYIIFVNPQILSVTGMDPGALFVATCLAAAFGESDNQLASHLTAGPKAGSS